MRFQRWLFRRVLCDTRIFGCLILGSFYAYEVCFEIDPNAHPVLKTYLSAYGQNKTFLAVIILQAISLLSANYFSYLLEAAVTSLALLIGFPVLVSRKYKDRRLS